MDSEWQELNAVAILSGIHIIVVSKIFILREVFPQVFCLPVV